MFLLKTELFMRSCPVRPVVTPDYTPFICHTAVNSTAVPADLLDFKPMTVASIPEIRRFMNFNLWRTCDYTLGGMIMWADYFNYMYCVRENTLFVKGEFENHPGVTAFSLPLGNMAMTDAVELIARYCRRTGTRMAFSAIPAVVAGDIAAACGGKVEPLNGWSDYLYSASALATLSGKTYSKKRNHVNRFMADNPSYCFEKVSVANQAEVREFIALRDVADKACEETAAYELQQCLEVVCHLGDYLFEGALLRDGSGKICAVTFGEVVGDTLYVHIEKADHSVAGAGETVCRLFVETMLENYPGLRYVNREEDMGDPGLRYSKESYRPVALLDKCNVVTR